MMAFWLLVIGLSAAQDPDTEAAETLEDDVDTVIMVYGDRALEEAMEAVGASLIELGWTPMERGDELVLKPPEAWIGRAIFTPDGRLDFQAPVLGLQLGRSGLNASGDYARQLRHDACGEIDEGFEYRVRGELPGVELSQVAVTFSLYETAEATRSIWSETQELVLSDGHYTAFLGRIQPLDAYAKERGALLGISAGGVEGPRSPLDDVAVLSSTGIPLGPCLAAGPAYDPWDPTRQGATQAVGVGIILAPSAEKRAPHVAEALAASEAAVSHYRSVLQETSLQHRLERLPETLDALWQYGSPIYGTRPIDGWTSRRVAVLEHWASRSDNRAGQAICASIEGWLAEVVLYSDQPITDAEYSQYEARRTDGRTLPR